MKLEALATEAPPVGSPFDFRVSEAAKVEETDISSARESGDWGFFHSFTTGSALDGPGVRVVVWLTGCQFRCVFCHNPDTWKMHNGIPVALSRAVEEVRKYRHALRTMEGGLTVSGGEPLVQDRFVVRLFTEARKNGIHTTLDSNGHLGERLSDADLEQVDLVMLGLKAATAELHKRITGQDNAKTFAFARRLAARKKPMWFRFVLVPGLTDSIEEVERVADFAVSLGNVEQIEVLRFHQLGRFKWLNLEMRYELEEAAPPSRDVVLQALDIFRLR